MVGPRTALVTAAFVLALVVPPICQAFSASQTLRPTATVCALLPIADLETLYGATAGTPSAAGAMSASSKPGMTHESRDYGDVGCRRVTATQDLDNKPMPRPIVSTSCFQTNGGYLILTLTSDNAGLVTDEHVKTLLAKAAARRSS